MTVAIETMTDAQAAALFASQVRSVSFSATVPLDGNKVMAAQTVSSVIAFTPSSSPVLGAQAYVRLAANGTNAPTFAGFTEHGSSAGYLNTNGVVNMVRFWYDGVTSYFAVSQALNLGSSTPTPAPKFVWDAASLTGQTNNAAISSAWVDSVSGISAQQSTTANQPIYVANAYNGKPGVKSDGTKFMPIAAPGAYKTAIDSLTYSIIDVVVGTGTPPSGYGSTGGASTDGSHFLPYLVPGGAGLFSNGEYPTYSVSSGFEVAGFAVSPGNHGGAATSGFLRYYARGACILGRQGGQEFAASNAGFALLAGNDTGQFGANTTLLARYVFDVELTPVQYARWTKYIYDQFGATHPMAASDYAFLFHGDSLTLGIGATSFDNRMPNLIASSLSMPVGTWWNVGIGGLSSQDCIDRAASDVDGIGAIFGKPMMIQFQNIANDVRNGVSNATTVANHTTYCSGRRSANPSCKIIGMTPADWTTSNFTTGNGEAWTNSLVANYSSIGYNAIARVDQNATIGKGASWNTYPEGGPWSSPFSDGVHFATYSIQAGIVGPVIQANR